MKIMGIEVNNLSLDDLMSNPVNQADLVEQPPKEFPELSTNERYKICESCEHFRASIKQCKKCGCFMPLKVNVPGAKCPVNKW